MSYLIIFVLIFSIVTASLGQIFLRKGALSLSGLELSLSAVLNLILAPFQNKWLLVGTLLFIISFFSYIFILSKIQLSFAYPVTVSLGIILVALGSQFFLKEQLSFGNIIGIVLIIVGILLLAPKS